jgi:hypothetical protein
MPPYVRGDRSTKTICGGSFFTVLTSDGLEPTARIIRPSFHSLSGHQDQRIDPSGLLGSPFLHAVGYRQRKHNVHMAALSHQHVRAISGRSRPET